MSAVGSPSLFYQYIIKSEYEDALSTLETLQERDLDDIYALQNGKNCIHLIIDKLPNPESEKLLIEIIKITEKFKQVSRFQNCRPFQYALQAHHEEHFNYLLKNRVDLLEENAIAECLHLIATKKKLSERCEIFLKNLDVKHFHWISNPFEKTKTSPLIESIERMRMHIFETFISHLTRVPSEENRKKLIFMPQQNGDTILHSIAKISSGNLFFRKLLKVQILNPISQEKSEKTLLPDVLSQIDKTNNQAKTPLFIANESGNMKMVEELLKYGADFTIPSNAEWSEDRNPLNEKSLTQKKIPKDIAQNAEIRKLLQDAEYGLIEISDGLPEKMVKTIQKRKEEGLLKCCREGKLEHAKKLIKNYKIDPFITDENQNSLAMIMFNHQVSEKTIIEFIDFLIREKKLDFKHVNKDRNTILILSVIKNTDNITLHLVEKYSKYLNINHLNSTKNTALSIAAFNGNMKILKLFLEKYVNIDLKGEQGLNIIYSLLKNLTEVQKEKKKSTPPLDKETLKQIEAIKEWKSNDKKKEKEKKLKEQEKKIKELEEAIQQDLVFCRELLNEVKGARQI